MGSLYQMMASVTSTPLASMTGALSRYFAPFTPYSDQDHTSLFQRCGKSFILSHSDPIRQLQDYPSLGHINHVAKEHSVNLVWAVTGEHLSLYKRLTQMISTSVAGQISSDSSNVVELVLILIYAFFFSSLVDNRCGRCTRRSQQASRLRTTPHPRFQFITPVTAMAERLRRKGL